MKSFFPVIFLVFSVGIACGQQNFTLYNMEYLGQRLHTNPAFVPKSKVHIGIPALSSIYFNVGNGGFSYSDVVRRRDDDSLFLDIDHLLTKLKDKNYITQNLALDVLHVGFRIKKQHYINFHGGVRQSLSVRYPKDFVSFIWQGNAASIGQELNFNFGMNMSAYVEVGAGYAYTAKDEKWTVGGKVKVLNGLANLNTEKFDVILHTDPNDLYTITSRADIAINGSGIGREIDTQTGDTSWVFDKVGPGNGSGLGFDLGAQYALTEKINLSFSAIDIGSIKWKNNVSNFRSKNPDKEFKFSGVDISDLSADDADTTDVAKVIGDSLRSTFNLEESNEEYKTSLPTQIHVGATYNITDRQKVGGLLYFYSFDGAVIPGFSVSYDKTFGHWCTLAFSYTNFNRSNNIGFGLRMNGGPFQYYLIADNLLAVVRPQRAKYVNFRTGFNLTFGNKKKKDEKESAPRIE